MPQLYSPNLGATSTNDPYSVIADDIAIWLERISSQIADAMKPQGLAPFAVQLSDAEKIAYYKDQLFTPDGQPNMQGRAAEMQRLGPAGFRLVYKAVIKQYPALAIPSPGPEQATPDFAPPEEASTPAQTPPSPTGGVGGSQPIGRGHRT